MLTLVANTAKTRQAGGWSTPDPQPPAPGPLLRNMSTKMEGPGVCEKMRTARWFSTSFKPPFISSCFRPLTFFRFKPFIFSSERNVLPPLPETLCFFERARRSPASAGKPLFFLASATFSCLLPFAHSVFSIPWSLFLFRGRRQLPQAGEVRRPLGPAWRAAR